MKIISEIALSTPFVIAAILLTLFAMFKMLGVKWALILVVAGLSASGLIWNQFQAPTNVKLLLINGVVAIAWTLLEVFRNQR